MALTKAPAELLNLDSSLTISGTTPSLTIGDAGAEDTKIVFDGNAQDYYVGLDDSADSLVMGLGSTLGTTPAITIDSTQRVLIGTDSGDSFNADSMLRLGRAGDRIFIQLKTDAGQDSGILFGDVDDDVECAVQYDNANKALKLTANNGDERLRLGISESVVNEDSESIDFRVEGDSNANVLFVDASTDRVGIGTNSPSTGLSVAAVLSLEPASLGAISASDSRPNLARSADGELRIAAGKDSSGFITFHVTPNGSTNVAERFKIADNITFTGRSGTSPIFSLVNVDTEDVNTGRETSIRFSGFRSGGESVDNAQISGNHSGSADDDKGGLFFYTNGGSGLGERMRITNADVIINDDHNDQDFRVESDSNAFQLFVDASLNFVGINKSTRVSTCDMSINAGSNPGIQSQNLTTGSSNLILDVRSNGTSIIGEINATNTATQFNTSSDYRLKENVKTLKDGLDRLNQLKPVQFTWTTDGSLSEGFIAHEVEYLFPDAVSGEKDAVDEEGNIDPQQVDYGRITPLLVKAIQEQQEQIEELKTEIAKLKGE